MTTALQAPLRSPILTALALSLGAAISLGISRFSYALLLPPMRADLDWSYLLAGMMNTANAAGYLIGALLTPLLMRRCTAQTMLTGGAVLTACFMLLSGFVTEASLLLVQRVLAGVASAFIFVAGGVLAARLGSLYPQRAGLLIGIYYGGTGFGITLSALLIPFGLQMATAHQAAHPWQWAWISLAALCVVALALMVTGVRTLHVEPVQNSPRERVAIGVLGFGLAGYFMFGVGYIGYMTFVIALLREQGMSAHGVTLFYALLGMAVVASSRIWSGMLDRYKGGRPMATLNGLLSLATLLPVISSHPAAVFASGLLFGAVFLSVVASTTALVRHNLPPVAWSFGISMFTIVFAAGQIVGPAVVGWVSDGTGGLGSGLVFSAGALLLGALVAARQQAVNN